MASVREADAVKHSTPPRARAGKPLLIACIALLLLAAVALRVYQQTPDPIYQGKSVSQWFAEIQNKGGMIDSRNPAVQALVEIGEPAVPFLVQQYTQPPSPLKASLSSWTQKLPPLLRWHRISDFDRSFRASVVLQALGPKAKAAIPGLIRLAENKQSEHRAQAVQLMGIIHGEPERVIPALHRLLSDPQVRVYAAVTLAKYGRQAAKAVPQLREMLRASYEERSRAAAVVALLAMAESPDLAMPAARDLLASTNQETRRFLLDTIEKLDTDAKAVVPVLQEALQNPDPSIRKAAALALKKIDPAQAGFK